MSAYGLLGLSQGLNQGIADQAAAARQGRLDALNADAVNQKIADSQIGDQIKLGLYPGQLSAQQANLGLTTAKTGQVGAETAATTQKTAADAAMQPLIANKTKADTAAANAAAAANTAKGAQTNFKLSSDQLNAVRGAQSSFVQAMGTQLQSGKIDTRALENTYNSNLPDSMAGKGIKPGSMQFDKNTGNFSFVTKTGHVVSGNYSTLKAGLVAPTKDGTLTPAQTVTASTQWTNTAKGLISNAFGAGFNADGTYNPGSDPGLSSKLTGIAVQVGQGAGYQNIPAAVVANAVVQANAEFGGSKNGIVGDGTGNPNFMARVRQLVQVGNAERAQQSAGPGGIPSQAPQQPNLGMNPPPSAQAQQQPRQPPQPASRTAGAPYPDGTRLQGPDGKIYIVQNGRPVLAPNQ